MRDNTSILFESICNVYACLFAVGALFSARHGLPTSTLDPKDSLTRNRSNAVKRQPLVVKEPEELEGAARGIYQKEAGRELRR